MRWVSGPREVRVYRRRRNRGTEARNKMGCRDGLQAKVEMGYRREMRWVPREARDDTEGQRRRGTTQRDRGGEGRREVTGEGRREATERVKERRRSGAG
ncbi:hypothetical protein OIU78_024363, partial [Salix suchowensis]